MNKNRLQPFWVLLAIFGLQSTAFSQEITITGFADGALSFSNSAPASQRAIYTIEWRSNLSQSSGWSNSWDALREFSSTNHVLTSEVPSFYRVVAYFDNVTSDTNVMLNETMG